MSSNGHNGQEPQLIPSSLAGKRIVVTRALSQAGKFNQMLLNRGAIPLSYPCIDIKPLKDTRELDAQLQAAVDGRFDWLIVTSTNVVTELSKRMRDLGWTLHENLQVAAVGRITAGAVELLLEKNVSLIPKKYTGEKLAATMKLAPGTTVLLPQTNIAPPDTQDALAAAGGDVTRVTIYQTLMGHGGIDLPAALQNGEIDAITFTSASIVRNFVMRMEAEGGDIERLHKICLACIGATTASAAVDVGLPPVLVPKTYNLNGLLKLLESYFEI